MELGLVSAILFDLNLEEVLSFAAAEDYDCVELMCWPLGRADRRYGGVTHVDVTDFTAAAADDINSLADKYKVGISGLGYYPNILSGNADESRVAIEHLRRVIVAARMLRLKQVNTFIGNDHRLGVGPNFARFKEVWPAIVEFAEENGVFLGIENCPMLFSDDEWPAGKNLAYSPAIWREMFDTIPSTHFGLNYDPSHLVWLMIDHLAPLQEFGDRIFHVHAKDMKIDRAALNDLGVLSRGWSIPKIPGLGDIQWNRVISELTDLQYEGAVCVEVEDDAFASDLEARQKALRISHNVLRPLIPR